MVFTNENWIDILNSITDGIYITDREGNTLWVNDASAKNLGRTRSDLIGLNSFDLEKQGIVKPSVVRMTLEAKKTISIVQSVDTGQSYVVTGHFIHNKKGEIEFIVVHSRDITQAVNLSQQLEEMDALLNRYSEEIRQLTLEKNIQNIKRTFKVNSKSYLEILEQANRLSQVDTNVLITGETGVGKNTIAKQIHLSSHRCKHPFIEVNCGAIPESLIESELFGYKKGAFTGANSNGKAGLIELANKGTLLLDEIGELPHHLQSKLLQFLQSKTYRSVGGTVEKRADVRILAATNGDLMEMVVKKKFRADLYYRINIIPLDIPPLRERQEDIIPLINFFLDELKEKYHSQALLTEEAIRLLQNYDWPGNIRELENLIERLVITAKSNRIDVKDLPNYIKMGEGKKMRNKEKGNESLPQILESIESTYIEEALVQYKTTRRAAEALGVTQSYLMRRLKKYRIVNKN